jgi:NAD(P)-dependent dehydrogenase (short-subunit alcohol dehydrogenase family)
MKRFEDKNVLMTGASGGIGQGIAQGFADEGRIFFRPIA